MRQLDTTAPQTSSRTDLKELISRSIRSDFWDSNLSNNFATMSDEKSVSENAKEDCQPIQKTAKQLEKEAVKAAKLAKLQQKQAALAAKSVGQKQHEDPKAEVSRHRVEKKYFVTIADHCTSCKQEWLISN